MSEISNLPFGFDTPEDSPGFLLWQTTMMWQRQIRSALEPYNISHPQFVIMATLMWFEANEHDITQILIINQTKLDKMTVSKSLKKLMEDGYLKRNEHQKDSRAKSALLTNEGKLMVKKLVPIVEGIDAQFFKSLSASQEKQFISILKQITRQTDDI